MGANGKVEWYGSWTDLGGRATQQDLAMLGSNMFVEDNHVYHVFGIFDGHGSDGHKAAKAAVDQFRKLIELERKALSQKPTETLSLIFEQVHEELKNDSSWDSYLSGTTATICILVNERLYFGHVGDSRLVIYSGNGNELKGRVITTDHTCENKEEMARVVSKGARVEQLSINGKPDGPLRIFKGTLPYPGIAITRTLGDSASRSCGVISTPEVGMVQLNAQDSYLILGTDGVWDAITVEDIKKNLGAGNPSDLAKQIIKQSLEGLAKHSIDDNVTVIVVCLKDLFK